MNFPLPFFSQEAIDAAKKHAVDEFPKESCGFIVNDRYVPCVNKSGTPEKDFVIDTADYLDAGQELQAVIHSHPQPLSPAPTQSDMQGQIDTNCIWGIIPCNQNEAFEPIFWGDYLLEGHVRHGVFHQGLIGREFIPGASDCYTLIRAYFWQVKGIRLPEFARDGFWWKSGEDIYRASFGKAGFRRIEEKEAREGDVFLGQVRSDVPNHGGVLLERGLGLHHLDKAVSRREPIARWQKHITHWLRFEGLPSE